jgi:AcrR family transcriptional regulator
MATVARSALRAAATPRADNRLRIVLDAAARLFRERGYASTSMRDIATASGMLPGSLYYHFPSKEALLVAVYGEGVGHIKAAVESALEREGDPWERLERVCTAHLETLLSGSDYAQVVVRVRPDDVPEFADALTTLRDGYERTFAQSIQSLPLPRPTDRRALKLMLLGALNWSQTWYRPGGDSPAVVARRFLRLLRDTHDR